MAAEAGSGCATVVHGVVSGRGSLVPGWLPPKFGPLAGSQSTSSLPDSTFTTFNSHPDPPRIMLGTAIQPAPLTSAEGGRANGKPVKVHGQRAFLESGPPDPPFIGVYWKSGKYLISVIGYRLSPSTVLRVARNVTFTPPGIVELPVTHGKIVSRQAAIKAAGGRPGAAEAKLSSWTEVQAVAERAGRMPLASALLNRSPWLPVWAVRLTGTPYVEVVSAALGQPVLRMTDSRSWFAALTDRDPVKAGTCPGGSTALVPFGVLTRDEQSFTGARSVSASPRTSVRLVLSTVPAVNHADEGLYGGCVQQNCAIDQLVWVTITTVRAAPGKTIGCIPPGFSVPPGYKPKRGTEYYTVDVPDNSGGNCGPVPAALRELKDLAPPG